MQTLSLVTWGSRGMATYLHAKVFIGYMMVTWHVDLPSFWTRSAEQSPSFTLTFRRYGSMLKNQRFTLHLTSLCQNIFWHKNFKISISQILGKNLLAEKEKQSKSRFEQDLAYFSTSSTNPEATSIYPAAAEQQLALIQQQPSSNKHSSGSSPAATSIHPAAAQQPLAFIQQQPSSN